MSKRTWIKWVGMAIVAFPYALVVQAASYDCAEATTAAEITVCEYGDLNRLDEELSDSYRSLIGRVNSRQAAQLRRDQRSWLKARNSCRRDVRCLRARYQERLAHLREIEERD